MPKLSSAVRALLAGVMTSISGLGVAAPSFSFSLLHEPNITSGHAYAMNDAGDVAGLWPYATIWRDGVAQGVSGAFDEFSVVYGLNNFGDAVGYSGPGFGVATLWRNMAATQLTTPEGSRSVAVALNDHGTIVGTYEPISSSGRPRAVVWLNDSITELAMPDGAYASSANAINNDGWVVGGSGPGASFWRATMWQGDVATVLPTLGGNISYANDVNDMGVIVGMSWLGNGSIRQHATLWIDGAAVDLGALPGFLNSSANAINNSGWVVGVSSTDYWFEDRATVWIDGEAIDLNTFLDDQQVSAGWVLRSAVDINRSGVIVGNAYNEFSGMTQIFLMTPAVPEPQTRALLLAGFVVMALFARRQRRN